MLRTYAYPADITVDDDGRFVVAFADLPEALTDGATLDEALREASDCLSEALASRLAGKEPIPKPSPLNGRQLISPDLTLALKLALNQAMDEQKFTAARLARVLEIDHKEARRLLDPRETSSKAARIERALSELGVVTTSTFRQRRLPTPKRSALVEAALRTQQQAARDKTARPKTARSRSGISAALADKRNRRQRELED
jgi:antitoxin HicB